MLGFIIILILLLIGTVVWSIRVKENSEGNKFIRLLPYWVIAYGVSMALLCPVAFFSIWEYNIDFILTCVVLSIALLIIAAFVVAIIKKQYRNAGRIVGIGVILGVAIRYRKTWSITNLL